MDVHIEAQPLESALRDFTPQSGLQVLFPINVLNAEYAPELTGKVTPEAALKSLLGD